MTIAAVSNLTKTFAVRSRTGTRELRAVDDVSFDVAEGETLGVVGESGSGKSTTGRLLVGLLAASAGSITLFGRDITGPDGATALAAVRPRLQMVFQDPNGALDPRMTAGQSIAEPLAVAGTLDRRARAARVLELLDIVGLPRGAADRHPHEFSGGQRQRICIARALALNPSFIVCDEAVSALDVSMQAQIVNLLLDLQESMGLSYLFIAHDLAVVRSISSRVAVMYAGRLVEIAPRAALYDAPSHPYTKALLAAVPRPVPGAERAARIGGEVPSLLDKPPGCAFHTRCPEAFDRCRVEVPRLRRAGAALCACHLYEES
jgi:oligopeptide/dipeptide ABC transporter ATP-binding protein